MNRDGTTRIFIVERFPIITFGISRLVQGSDTFTVCGHALSFELAVRLIDRLEPDVVIFDLEMEGDAGFLFLEQLVQDHPGIRPIVLTSCEDPLIAGEAISRGAVGYVGKSEHSRHILAAVQRVLDGGVYMTEERLIDLFEDLFGGSAGRPRVPPIGRLTRRETQVLRLIGMGMGVQGIAERMGISVSTVESHRSHIRDKTGLRNAAELRAFAVRWARIEGWQVIPGEHGIPTVTREDGEHVYDDPRDGRRERAPAYAIEDRRNT